MFRDQRFSDYAENKTYGKKTNPIPLRVNKYEERKAGELNPIMKNKQQRDMYQTGRSMVVERRSEDMSEFYSLNKRNQFVKNYK